MAAPAQPSTHLGMKPSVRPCGISGRLLSLFLTIVLVASAACASDAQNTLLWSTNYYPVSGTDTDELRASMHRSKPWKEESDMALLVGLTTWHIEWRFKVTPTPNGCRCSSFTTRTAITNTLPRWLPPTNAPPQLKTVWTRFATALGQHEDGHSRLALAAVAEMHKQVKALGENSDCDALKRSINEVAQRTLAEFRKRDLEYDRTTNHGVTQGASLSNPARSPDRD
jgi:predicted secreted Zn-dependent protease